MNFFDCNVTIGKIPKPTPGGVLDAAKLLAEMDRYGIEEALLCHAFARRYTPGPGNALAVEAAAQSDRLHACWYVLPPATGETLPLTELAEAMCKAGVRAVRIAPNAEAHGFTLAKVVCGDLFDWLARMRVPLFVEQTALPWRDLDEIMEGYPDLRLVLTNVGYRIDRDLYPRLAAYPGLHVETSGLEQHCGIEELCNRFGYDRLLFGSRLPLMCAGAAIHAVEKAAISTEARRALAGESLRRLLGEVRLAD